MTEKFETNNLTPIISTISAGKTSLLNSIYNFDFLQVAAGIGTKFVNIIRFNQNFGKIPKFYHLIVKKNDKTNDYEFFKDLKTEIVGDKNIKKKNIEINTQLKEKNVPFEKIFYLVEVGEISLIKDFDYLKNYDLVDIPGLSEYIPQEKPKKYHKKIIKNYNDAPNARNNPRLDLEKESSFDPKKDNSYLTGIFKIIKNKVNNGIIMIDVQKIKHEENFKIIGRFSKILEKPITNFLILLNKMDLSDDINKDIEILESQIIKSFPTGEKFNFTKNTLVPCSTINIKNEMNFENNFKYLLLYHHYNYSIKAKKKENYTFVAHLIFILKELRNLEKQIPDRMKRSEIIENIQKFIDNKNLIDILKEIKEVIEIIEEFNKGKEELKIGQINKEDFTVENIKNILEKLKNNEDESDEDDEIVNKNNIEINDLLEELKEEIIIILYYNYFKDKKYIPPISLNNKKIMKYFTMKKMQKGKQNDITIIPTNKNTKTLEEILKNLDDLSQKYTKYYNTYTSESKPDNLKIARDNIDKIKKKLKISKYFYIPIIGLNNVGKSTIINCLIGYKLLPCYSGETTKKGVLIKYWDKDYPEIFKAKFKQSSYGDYYFETIQSLAKGTKDVIRFLNGINDEFTDKEEDFFYEIYTRIKFVDEMGIDERFKEKICFIDLPGFGTNNNFENKDTYSHLMDCCEIFLFVFRNLIINENSNVKMINELINKIKDSRSKVSTSYLFLQQCFFIINYDKSQEITQTSLDEAKKYIVQIIGGHNNKRIKYIKYLYKNTNVCFFNSKYYENYLADLNQFQHPENLIKSEIKKYDELREDLYKGLLQETKFNKSFYFHIKSVLEVKLGKIEKEKEKELITDEELKKILKNILDKKNVIIKDSNIDKIINYLIIGEKKFKESNLLPDSKYENFSKEILEHIYAGKKRKKNKINININRSLNILNSIFKETVRKIKAPNSPNCENIVYKMKDLDNEINNISNIIKKIEQELFNEKRENKIILILNESFEDLRKSLIKEKINIYKDKDNQVEGVKDLLKKVFKFLASNFDYLYSNNWREIQIKFEEVFIEKTKSLKDKLKDAIYNYSKNVEKYIEEINNIINKVKKESKEFGIEIDIEEIIIPNLEDDLVSRFEYDKDKKIDDVLDHIVNDIITGSKECVNWEKSKSTLDYIKGKFLNNEYLNKIIDDMIKNSVDKFGGFIKSFEKNISEFNNNIIYNLETRNVNLSDHIKNLIEQEELENKLKNEKNEAKKKEYEEKKKCYEKKKEEMDKIGDDYSLINKKINNYINQEY